MPKPKLLAAVIHAPPLPGSPRAWTMPRVLAQVARDASLLARAGFERIVVENFGDAPFFAARVPPVTVAALTACVLQARAAAPDAMVGVNVLRNDAEAAISIAAVTGASFVRVNVHAGARVTDQGVVQGRAAETMRLRASLAARAAVWADVDVKHSAPLGARPVEDEARDVALRGLADAVLVTGSGTGRAVDLGKLGRVRASLPPRTQVLAASGATAASLRDLLAACDGVVVGSALKVGGRAGAPVDPARARRFVAAFRRAAG